MTTPNIRLTGIIVTICVLLLIPFIAMRFTSEVDWGPFDFLIAAVLLFGTGLAIEFVLRKVPKLSHRIAITAAILFALFLVWAELAVGLFGTPFAGS